jgi:hypothetical protein
MKKNPSQVELLVTHLLCGVPIDRVNAYKWYGIADLRSRLSDAKRDYGLVPDRWTKNGKKYLEYQLTQPYGK